jgi:hypothetical protein
LPTVGTSADAGFAHRAFDYSHRPVIDAHEIRSRLINSADQRRARLRCGNGRQRARIPTRADTNVAVDVTLAKRRSLKCPGKDRNRRKEKLNESVKD